MNRCVDGKPNEAQTNSQTQWTSRKRLLTALNCGQPDRVPVNTYELAGFNSHAWENKEPSYRRLMDTIREKTDSIVMWHPGVTNVPQPKTEMHFQSAYALPVDVTQEIFSDRRRVTRIAHTPKGDLRQVTEIENHVHTVWTIEHWCKNLDDVDKALSVPYIPLDFHASDLPRLQNEVQEHGIVMISLGDPAYIAADLMSFQDYTLWAYEDTEHYAHAVEVMAERVYENLRRMLDACVVDLYRICGPEYMTPPYLGPDMFRRFMVPHLKKMTQMIHERGGKVRVHCHGKIAKVIDMMLESGCDGIDPCEPPPDGDLELDEVKRRCAAKHVSVFGNIELKLLEQGSTAQVRDEVRRVMSQAKAGGGFVIMPTAAPINIPLAEKTQDNYFTFIDTALECGKYE